MDMDNIEQYRELVETLNKYSYNYHILNISLISDEEYDQLYKKLVEIEKLHPEWKSDNSPTNRVGETLGKSFTKNKHIKKMYSLDNIFTVKDMAQWVFETSIKLDRNNKKFIITPKLDGLSLNLLYENGTLVKATTRGDGLIGENVTKNAEYVRGIPKNIPYEGTIEIRGEVLISKKNFKLLNDTRLRRGEDEFKTARNAAAGSIRQLDPLITKERNLDFVAWGLGKQDNVFKSVSEFFKYFTELEGVMPIPYVEVELDGNSMNGEVMTNLVNSLHSRFEGYRNEGEYDIDGIVYMVNDFSQSESLGYTIRSPRFGIAYKFQATEYRTKLIDVSWQVGRSGVLTPVGLIDPVNIDGVTVTKATLHNLEDIKKKNIKIGSDVVIIRSGDVIPKILGGTGGHKEITPPEVCPCCGTKTIITPNRIECPNEECKDRIVGNLIHMTSRDGLNIQGMGEEVIKDLVFKCNIKDRLGLMNITRSDLSKLDGYGEKKITNLLANIQLARGCPGWKFLNSLGINFLGKGNSQWLTKLYGLDFLLGKIDLRNFTISGFSRDTLNQIMTTIEKRNEEISQLYNMIEPTITRVPVKHREGITGKNFVITGTLSKPRETIKEMISLYGGKVTSSLSERTDYLVYGINPGSKYKDAQRLDITCITEEELNKMME